MGCLTGLVLRQVFDDPLQTLEVILKEAQSSITRSAE